MILLHISHGGPTFSRGVQMLISIETHIHVTITCDFPGGGGGVWTPIHLWICKCTDESVRPPFKLSYSKC